MSDPNSPKETDGNDVADQSVRDGAPVTQSADDTSVAAKAADFAELSAVTVPGTTASLDNLLDVTVTVTAELGRTTTSIGNLLKLGVGSVLELERAISEPVDLMAQGIRLARGEVVVVDDRFAIRIKEIVDPKKRGGSAPAA
jgi:flagellar motor switch protein FliN/FliY